MKHVLILFLFCVFVSACKKDVPTGFVQNSYRQRVLAALKDSIDEAMFTKLDFSKALHSQVNSNAQLFLTVPLLSPAQSDFLLLQTDRFGNIVQGRWVALSKDTTNKNRGFNGHIIIRSLKQNTLAESIIVDGHAPTLQAYNNTNLQAQLSLILPVDPQYNLLPEVVVVGYQKNDGGISFSNWLNTGSVFGGASGANSFYTPVSPHGGGTGSYNGGPISQTPSMELEKENVYTLPAIDLLKMFRCFDYITSVGAIFKIRLCTDLPSNNNPNETVESSGVSAGHTFLIISKSNNGISVTQSFGFYPKSAPSWYSALLPVSATVRDNGSQEINASIEMNLDVSQFNSIKQNCMEWAARQYQLSDYNCTDYALDVFNSVRTNPITVQPYKVVLPGSTNAYSATAEPVSVVINNSPQMLFTKLRLLKSAKGNESVNILIDQTHNSKAPISKGECN